MELRSKKGASITPDMAVDIKYPVSEELFLSYMCD